jgi:L-rhamnose-H+ transport protein
MEGHEASVALQWGFVYLLLGAICGGSFGLPSKYAPKNTPWENLWGPFFLLVTVAMPFLLGPALVKDFYGIFAQIGWANLVMPLTFGLLWGAGSMTLGMSFSLIGLSLAYSLNYGAQIVGGSLGPMLLHAPGRIATPAGTVILAGVAVCVAGVAVCGWAGVLKDRSLKKDEDTIADAAEDHRTKILAGMTLAVLSGVLCACYSMAASYTGPIATLATGSPFQNNDLQASVATTAVILWGGAVSSCLYCVFLLTRNGTWRNFASPGTGTILLVALVMAFLHNGAIFLFNLGFPKLGDLGLSAGYPTFMSFAIIVGNLHGFRTGEWRGASRQSIAWIVAGIGVLIVGVCVLAQGLAMK